MGNHRKLHLQSVFFILKWHKESTCARFRLYRNHGSANLLHITIKIIKSELPMNQVQQVWILIFTEWVDAKFEFIIFLEYYVLILSDVKELLKIQKNNSVRFSWFKSVRKISFFNFLNCMCIIITQAVSDLRALWQIEATIPRAGIRSDVVSGRQLLNLAKSMA